MALPGFPFQGIVEKVRNAASLNADSFILFTLSHGGHDVINGRKEEVLYGTDGKPVMKKCLVQYLDDTNSPNLKDKPRIVFFQSCRGGK
jgi:Caspase domain